MIVIGIIMFLTLFFSVVLGLINSGDLDNSGFFEKIESKPKKISACEYCGQNRRSSRCEGCGFDYRCM